MSGHSPEGDGHQVTRCLVIKHGHGSGTFFIFCFVFLTYLALQCLSPHPTRPRFPRPKASNTPTDDHTSAPSSPHCHQEPEPSIHGHPPPPLSFTLHQVKKLEVKSQEDHRARRNQPQTPAGLCRPAQQSGSVYVQPEPLPREGSIPTEDVVCGSGL